MFRPLMESPGEALRSSLQGQFEALHRRARTGRFWSRLTGREQKLLNLYEIAQATEIQNRRAAGVQTVPINMICGSESRGNDFDGLFRPLKTHTKERWVSIALARQNDVALPPVELTQINDCYFVRDGHHRISVAKANGQQEIEATITVWRGTEIELDAAPAPSAH